MEDDICLLERFLNGEHVAFEQLVRKYQDTVLNIVYSLVGRDREAEDIVQEVFLKVYAHAGSFRRDAQFSTWIYRIAVNMTYDFLRRRKNTVSDEAALENTPTSGANPQEALCGKERDALIRKAMAGIPFAYRSALVLRDVEGLEYAQIAKVLKCGIGTVESRIFRARQFLKEQLRTVLGE